MSDRLRPPNADEFMQALAQIDGKSPAVERSVRYWQEAAQVLPQSDTPLPLREAAAGFAAGQADVVGVSAAPEVLEALELPPEQGLIEPIVIHTVPDADVKNYVHVTFSGATATLATGPTAEQPRIALPPGVGLNRVLKLLLPRKYGRIFYPLIADAQHEWYIEALAHKKPTRWIEVRMWLLIAANALRLVVEWVVRLRG